MVYVIDGHIDTATAILRQYRLFSERSDRNHVDLPRMREGKVQAALFAIYPAMSRYNLINGLDIWFKLVEDPKNELMHIKKVSDFDKAKKEGKIGAVLHFEGAGGIDSEFQILRLAYRLGLRTMGISWSNINNYATGMLFQGPQVDRGLTLEGKELVKESQKLGITIDASHLNEPSFWDLMDVTEKPIFASHSNARAIGPHQRNLTNEQIKAIYDTKGTIGINFCASFLDKEMRINPDPVDLPLEIFKEHIDHIVEQTDINTVAMGSDYDGATVPECMSDCSTFPKLLDFLSDTYSKDDLEKIGSKNLMRVFSDTWK